MESQTGLTLWSPVLVSVAELRRARAEPDCGGPGVPARPGHHPRRCAGRGVAGVVAKWNCLCPRFPPVLISLPFADLTPGNILLKMDVDAPGQILVKLAVSARTSVAVQGDVPSAPAPHQCGIAVSACRTLGCLSVWTPRPRTCPTLAPARPSTWRQRCGFAFVRVYTLLHDHSSRAALPSLALQVVNERRTSLASDIFSFGVIAWCALACAWVLGEALQMFAIPSAAPGSAFGARCAGSCSPARAPLPCRSSRAWRCATRSSLASLPGTRRPPASSSWCSSECGRGCHLCGASVRSRLCGRESLHNVHVLLRLLQVRQAGASPAAHGAPGPGGAAGRGAATGAARSTVDVKAANLSCAHPHHIFWLGSRTNVKP